MKGETMLVTLKQILDLCEARTCAVGSFNTPNLESVMAVIGAAEELQVPVVIQHAEVHEEIMPLEVIGPVMTEAARRAKVPVCVHLDHGESLDYLCRALDLGFTSIMYDGSHSPIEENVANTTELVRICAEKGMSLEAEVGAIGGEEDGVVGNGECADPDECKMIADLGVTMLAAGIGNIHGKYPANWPGLSFDTLAAVSEKVGV